MPSFANVGIEQRTASPLPHMATQRQEESATAVSLDFASSQPIEDAQGENTLVQRQPAHDDPQEEQEERAQQDEDEDTDIDVDTETRGGGEFTATRELYTFDAIAEHVYGYAGEYSDALQEANPDIDPRAVIVGQTQFTLPEMMVPDDITFPEEDFDDDTPLDVPYGQQTFDAEGQEGGTYHSREPHAPGESSGVTIGRGYDMKNRTEDEIEEQLTDAGISDTVASEYRSAAGLEGDEAEEWVDNHSDEVGEITLEQQWNLFIQEYQRQTHEVVSYLIRIELEEQGDGTWEAPIDFEAMAPEILELLIDMDYRGDLRSEWEGDFRDGVIDNDTDALGEFVRNHDDWRNDIYDRYEARCEIMGVEPLPREEQE